MDYATKSGLELFALVFILPSAMVLVMAWFDDRRKARKLAQKMAEQVKEN